jgi:hypothetical protein
MDDPIRDLLSGLPKASMIRKPPGTVTIPRQHVVTAGDDA